MSELSNNIFLSWSEKTSNAVALVFNRYLPFIIQEARPFFSPEGINKDQDWFNKIKSELISTKTGIVFLTKENLKRDWIFFESGGIFSKSSLCVLLCDFDISYLKDEKSLFQYFNATLLAQKEDLLKLVFTINNVISPHVSSIVIQQTFDKYYDEFWNEIEHALLKTKKPESNTAKLEGKWNLKYKMRNGPFEGGENLRLTSDGKYYLDEKGGEIFYFQLNILDSKSNSFTWQKLRVIDGKPSDEVHSVEYLKISEDGKTIIGEDTVGYTLTYTKLE